MGVDTKRLFAVFLFATLTGCGGSRFTPAQTSQRVVFLGDSITAYWQQEGQEQTFTQNGWIDKGVVGQNSIQISYRFQSDVLDQHPDVVHILVGTNDVYPGWTLCSNPPGHATETEPANPDSWPYPVDTCTNIQYMVSTARRNGIRVILGTIPPWGPGGVSNAADPGEDRFRRIAELNNWIEAYGAYEGVQVVDYHALLADKNGMNYVPAYTGDGVHPSTAGITVMTKAVEKAVFPKRH